MATFIENEHKHLEDPVTKPRFVKRKTWRTIFCSKLVKGIITALVVATIIPTLAFFYALSANVSDDTVESYTCLIIEGFRLPCGNPGISENECNKVNCCFNSTTQQCHHYLPSKYYYTLNDGKYTASQTKSPVGTTILPEIKLTIQKKTNKQVSFIIHDPSEIVDSLDLNETDYTITLDDTKLNVNVSDQKGNTIFSTSSLTLIASNMFWEWGFELSSDALFGLDRNRIELEGNATLIKVIYKNKNDHYTLPVLWAYQGGSFYGILIRHEGPLEIQILASNIVILRTLVGNKLEVELSLGPTPTDLYNIQTENFVPPPLWALSTHHCRKGSSTVLGELLSIYQENVTSLFGTDCIHENLFVALQNSSVDQGNVTLLKEILRSFNDSGTKFLFSLPPHILIDDNNELYSNAKNLNILYQNEISGNIYNGTYLGANVAYPDFSNSTLAAQFMEMLVDWVNTILGLEYISGFVLNDNWPQDDSYVNADKTGLFYYSEELDKQIIYTLPWNLKGTNGVSHLNNHNLYGENQNFSLYSYLSSIQDNPLIISSTKTHSGSEPEISDNLETSWSNFNTYLNKILFSSISGNPMVGLPVCGDTTTYDKELHETLCVRWYLAAAVMPYFRVSSGSPFRDPGNLNTLYSTGIAQQAMNIRNLLQDYLYTLFHTNPPVVRPMYFDYFSNETTLSMERQYTISENIIVAHPLSSGRTRLQVYLPPSKGVWYEFWGGTKFATSETSYADIDFLDSDLVMFVAQGTIVALTNSSHFNLHIALNCTESCTAEGELLKDNNWLHFSATETNVTVSGLSVTNCGYSLSYIRVYHQDSNFFTNSNENILCGEAKSNVTITYETLS